MYKDLAHAIEDLKDKGIQNLFSGKDEEVVAEYLPKADQMKIIEHFRFDSGTDPGDESSVYVIETPEKEKKYIVTSYGTYMNPQKSKLLDALLQKSKAQH